MNVHEYQAKAVLLKLGLPIPEGEVATSPAEAKAIAQRLGGTVVVKAQVLVGGRGKAGGVKLAKTPDEAEAKARAILGMKIKDNTVQKVLVTRAVDIEREIYLGVILDRANKAVTVMASSAGGVDIEDVARDNPEKIIRIQLDPFIGLQDYQARQLAFALGLAGEQVRAFGPILRSLVATLLGSDASLIEINPLIIDKEGKLRAIDAKLVLDDNALFRHPDLAQLRDTEAEDPLEAQARVESLNYVKLDGNIGCVVNGAGLAMATMDVVKLHGQATGAAPANFLDIGGGARADRVSAALGIILGDPNVSVILFNIFGGITRCDEVARGIVSAKDTLPRKVPIVVRLVGTNEVEGRQILAEAGLIAVTSMDEAAKAAVQAAANARDQKSNGSEVRS